MAGIDQLPGEVVRIWEISTRTCVLKLIGTSAAAFSSDGKWLATSTRREICLFDSADWQQKHSWNTDVMTEIATVSRNVSAGNSTSGCRCFGACDQVV